MEHISNKRRYRKVRKDGTDFRVTRPIPSFEYFIDKDKEGKIDGRHYKGIVVAKMKDANCPLAFAWDRKYGYSYFSVENIYHQLFNREGCKVPRMPKMPNLTSVAYCFDGDSFDLEKGKEIARTKVLVKYYDWVYRILANFTRELYYFESFVTDMRKQMDYKFNTAYDKVMNNSYLK